MREDLRNDESLIPTDDVETALVKLQPRPSSLDRERLLFLAGKAAATAERSCVPRTKRWMWPLGTFASAAAMLAFGVLYAVERGRVRPAQTVVRHDPHPKAVSPKRSVVTTPRTDGSAKPQAAGRDVVAGPQPSDPVAAESRLLRSRHPVLMTDPDLLPNSAPAGGQGAANRLSVGDTRRTIREGLSATRPTASSPAGLPSILNQLRFGRGGL